MKDNKRKMTNKKKGELNVVVPICMMRWKMLHVCGQLRGSTFTRPYYVFLSTCVGLKGWQFSKGDVTFLDFSSHHVSINHVDTVMGFKGFDGI